MKITLDSNPSGTLLEMEAWENQALRAIVQGQSENDFVAHCHYDNRPKAIKAYRESAKVAAKAIRALNAHERMIEMLRDGAMQLERLDGENLKTYARTFAALARTAIAKADHFQAKEANQ